MFNLIKSNSFKSFIKKNLFNFSIILIFFFLTNIIELLGLSLIIPLSYYILGDTNEIANIKFFEFINFNYIIHFFFGIYIIKFIFSVFSYWLQHRKIYKIQNNLANLLLKTQFKTSFLVWNSKGNSNILQIMVNETENFCQSFLMPFVTIISEIIFLIILLIIMTFFYGPKIFLFIISIGLFILIYNSLIIKNIIKKIGISRIKFDKLRIKTLNDIILSFKEIKIFSKQNSFIKKFENENLNFLKTLTALGTYAQLPRLLIEILIIVFLLVIILLFDAQNFKSIIPQLAFFIGIFYRLMPSFNRIITSFQIIQFSKPTYKNIDQFLFDLEPKKSKDIISHNYDNFKKIDLKNLSFNYDEKKVFDDISLTLEKGKIYGIKGESGSGKSTLLNMICGLIKPDSGNIFVDGKDLASNDINWIRNVAYISQNSVLLNDTLLNNILFEYNPIKVDEKKLKDSISNARIKELIDSLKNGQDTIIGDRGSLISSGQSQRINIARVFYSDRDIFIFDEATNSLDRETEHQILRNIQNLNQKIQNKKLIIIVSHKIENLKICDYVLEIKNKKVVKTS